MTPTASGRPATSVALLLAVLLAACATTQPVLIQHDTPPTPAQQVRARSDVQHCLRLADERIGRNALQAPAGGSHAAKQTAQVAGVTFVGTAVAASVGRSQEVWQRARGAAAGGATAMGLKLLLDWNAPDEAYEKQVEHCLERRGHLVAGWR